MADISEVAADAIVNAANSELWMGSGVAGALKRKGGEEIELEAVRRGPIEPGQAVETKAGRLRAKWVIHAAVMGPDLKTDSAKIRDATRSAIALASSLGAKSVAFPLLGTGVGGFAVDEAAEIMLSEILDHCHTKRLPNRVMIVAYSGEALAIVDRVLSGMMKHISTPPAIPPQ